MLDSSAVHWFRTGSDECPLVLLHGFTGSPRSWEAVVSRLSGAHAVAALALPGHHPAARVAPGFEANIDWIAEQLERAQLHGCHLIGYSLGARAALGLALQHPGLAARLTLIGVHPGLDTEAERLQRMASDQVWIELLRTSGIEAFVAAWEQHALFATQVQVADEARAQQRRIRLGHDAEGLAQSLEHMGLGAMPGYGSRLAELRLPVTLIAGALDSKFVALAHAAAARISQAQIEIIAGSGHNIPLERPSELATVVSRPAR